MTSDDFTAAVADRLRRRGANFRQEDLEAFAAVAWLQERRRPDPDVCTERFLAELERRGRLRAVRARGAVLRWAAWAAGCTAVCLFLVIAGYSSFRQWPASTLAVAAVALIVAAVTLSRVPIDSRILRWALLIAVTTVFSVLALVLLLVSRCHL